MFHKKASILVFSLWILIILSVFAAGIYKISLSQIRIARYLEASVLSVYSLESLCEFLKWKIKNDNTVYDTLYELLEEKERTFGIVNILYELIDEESKVNVNFVPQRVLRGLPGIDEDIASAIFASELYPFSAKEELLLVEDLEPEAFSKFKNFITVKSNGKININTAPSEVLKSIGLENNLVDIIMEFRNGRDGEGATEDDGIFSNTGEIIEDLRDFSGLSDAQEQQLMVALAWLDVKSDFFSVKAETEILGKRIKEYDIIININRVIRWKER